MPCAGILELPKKLTICEAKLVPLIVKSVRVVLTPAVSLRVRVKSQLSPCFGLLFIDRVRAQDRSNVGVRGGTVPFGHEVVSVNRAQPGHEIISRSGAVAEETSRAIRSATHARDNVVSGGDVMEDIIVFGRAGKD